MYCKMYSTLFMSKVVLGSSTFYMLVPIWIVSLANAEEQMEIHEDASFAVKLHLRQFHLTPLIKSYS